MSSTRRTASRISRFNRDLRTLKGTTRFGIEMISLRFAGDAAILNASQGTRPALFKSNGQAMTALGAAAGERVPPVSGFHPLAEAVRSFALFIGSIRQVVFHDESK